MNIRPNRSIALSACIMAAILMPMTGCNDDETSADGTTAVTENTYVVPRNEPATTLSDPSVIEIESRLPGRHTGQSLRKMTLSEEEPRRVIQGKQILTKDEYTKFSRSRILRVEDLNEPPGARTVQIDVSMRSALELKQVATNDRGKFVPSLVLHDNIGNIYWPVGYFLKDIDNEMLTLHIDLQKNFRDLNRLPSLSKSKRQELTLVYQVNIGVTLIGVSYGGLERKSFNLEVTR